MRYSLVNNRLNNRDISLKHLRQYKTQTSILTSDEQRVPVKGAYERNRKTFKMRPENLERKVFHLLILPKLSLFYLSLQ